MKKELSPGVVIAIIVIVVIVVAGLIWKFAGGQKAKVVSMGEMKGPGKGMMVPPGGAKQAPPGGGQ